MFTEVVEEYRFILKNIDKIIERSGYRLGYISDKMGMHKASFYLKRKNAGFTVDELEKLLLIIRADELEDEVLLKMSLEDEKEGGSIPLKEALSETSQEERK